LVLGKVGFRATAGARWPAIFPAGLPSREDAGASEMTFRLPETFRTFQRIKQGEVSDERSWLPGELKKLKPK
jgi:hypothetical protein